MKIILIGYMGAGKSAVGQQLAANLQLLWLDLDQRIESSSGYSITETILNKGELFFRQAERNQLLLTLEEPQFVMSTGGGTPCYYDNIDLMNKHSITVYLEYSVLQLYERLEGQQSDRPLIAHLEGDALREYVGKHLFERANYYEKATFTIKCGEKSVDDIAAEIIEIVT